MLYHKQTQLWNNEDKIPTGSCYPTVIACLLDLPLDKVPYINLLYFHSKFEKDNLNLYRKLRYDLENKDLETKERYEGYISQHIGSQYNIWNQVLEMWLTSQGYFIDYCPNLDKFIKENPDKPYMVSGISLRGVQHIVIGMNGKFHHDPHPSDTFLIPESDSYKHTYTYLEKIENYKDMGKYYIND